MGDRVKAGDTVDNAGEGLPLVLVLQLQVADPLEQSGWNPGRDLFDGRQP